MPNGNITSAKILADSIVEWENIETSDNVKKIYTSIKNNLSQKEILQLIHLLQENSTPSSSRLTTMQVEFPRYLLPELNTHRAFSRNSASSRARPFSLTMKDVMERPFIPNRWMKTHKGMQGSEYFTLPKEIAILNNIYLEGRDKIVECAKKLNDMGVSKQHTNRLLEPYLMHSVLITATDWENFFALRANESAEIYIQDLAYTMMQAYNGSIPKNLKGGEWHIPFSDFMDIERIKTMLKDGETIDSFKIKIATARAARLSYTNFGDESKYNYQKDVELHDRLVDEGHWSPLEHSARAMNEQEIIVNGGYSGNFRGFVQYRKMFGDSENRKDKRIVQKN